MHRWIVNRWIVYRQLTQPAVKTVDMDVKTVLLSNLSLLDLSNKIEVSYCKTIN